MNKGRLNLNLHWGISFPAISLFSNFRDASRFLVLLFLSAFFIVSCRKQTGSGEEQPTHRDLSVPSEITITDSPDFPGTTAELFVFDNDKTGKFDTYRKIELGSDTPYLIEHSEGEKILSVTCSPGNALLMKNADVSSYRNFVRDAIAEFRYDSMDSPYMSATVQLHAFSTVTLQKVMSAIRINSIRCDFSGSELEGTPLTDVSIYLINVSAFCRMLMPPPYETSELINRGFLCEGDMESLPDPGMLMQKIKGNVGASASYPGIELFCYPNQNPEETQLCPFTRLVVEGKINGKTYYWSYNVGGGTGGIARSSKYTLDIEIRRPGTTDPDIPAIETSMNVKCNTNIWEDKNEQYEIF